MRHVHPKYAFLAEGLRLVFLSVIEDGSTDRCKPHLVDRININLS